VGKHLDWQFLLVITNLLMLLLAQQQSISVTHPKGPHLDLNRDSGTGDESCS